MPLLVTSEKDFSFLALTLGADVINQTQYLKFNHGQICKFMQRCQISRRACLLLAQLTSQAQVFSQDWSLSASWASCFKLHLLGLKVGCWQANVGIGDSQIYLPLMGKKMANPPWWILQKLFSSFLSAGITRLQHATQAVRNWHVILQKKKGMIW